MQAGAFDAALRLVATAEAGPLDEFQRALVDLLRAEVAFGAGRWSDAPQLLLNAARQLEPFDADLARETYLVAWGAAGLAEDLTARHVLPDICRAASALDPRPGSPRPLDLLLEGFSLLITRGHGTATPTLQGAARALAQIPAEDVFRWGWMAAGASAAVWDDEGLLASCARQVQVLREVGALAALPIHLTYLAMATLWTGDFAGAASLIAEVENVAAVSKTITPKPKTKKKKG